MTGADPLDWWRGMEGVLREIDTARKLANEVESYRWTEGLLRASDEFRSQHHALAEYAVMESIRSQREIQELATQIGRGMNTFVPALQVGPVWEEAFFRRLWALSAGLGEFRAQEIATASVEALQEVHSEGQTPRGVDKQQLFLFVLGLVLSWLLTRPDAARQESFRTAVAAEFQAERFRDEAQRARDESAVRLIRMLLERGMPTHTVPRHRVLRSEPSATADRVGDVPAGAGVWVMDRAGDWARAVYYDLELDREVEGWLYSVGLRSAGSDAGEN